LFKFSEDFLKIAFDQLNRCLKLFNWKSFKNLLNLHFKKSH